MPCRRIDILQHCNDVMCQLGRKYFLKEVCNDVMCQLDRKYFLKEVVPSFEKQSPR